MKRLFTNFALPLGMVILITLIVTPVRAQNTRTIPDDDRQLAYEIYKELIEYKTTASEQNNTRAVEGMAAWLQAAGFAAEDVFIGGPLPHKGNLVATLRGTGQQRPMVLMAHIDVVEAERESGTHVRVTEAEVVYVAVDRDRKPVPVSTPKPTA